MTTEICIGAQGEVRIYKVAAMPDGVKPVKIERTNKGAIISHSESGHHHVLTGDADIMEHPAPPAGMRILYAILDKPQSLIQDAPVPHGGYDLEPGIYRFAMDREFNPFAEEVRRAAD